MKLVILTGMSGAGKSTALKMMEDIGFYCVDNLPIPLIEKFIELADLRNTELQKVAVGVDIRSGQALEDLQDILDHLRGEGKEFDVLFLDAEDGVLVKRYKETRRTHPLSGGERVDRGIAEERVRMEFLKKQADYILDTSNMLTRELKTELEKIFVQNQSYRNLFITIVSFGFKYGIPTDSDLVFDVRFLPNPYYDPEMRTMTGLDKKVSDFVLDHPKTQEFWKAWTQLLDTVMPGYIAEGKPQLSIAIGCTGGQHRSVAIAEATARYLEGAQYHVSISHRDLSRANTKA